MSCVVCLSWMYGGAVCARTGSRKCAEGFKGGVETVSHTHTHAVYRLLIKCAAGSRYVNLRRTAVLCFTMRRKESLPEECCSPGEVSDCAIMVSLSKETKLGKAHTYSFLLQSLWQLLSKQSPPQSRRRPVGGALFHRTWVGFMFPGATRGLCVLCEDEASPSTPGGEFQP